MSKPIREPLAHLRKRTEVSTKYAWGVRVAAFALSILACAIVTTLLTEKSMGFFFKNFFNGLFGTSRRMWNLVHETAVLLIVALAVTPCFKMRFWNIGGEGQILMGALGAAIIINAMPTSPTAVTVLLSLVLAVTFSVIWAVIPAIFKAFWNTNETLLTLMLNYIATCLTAYFIKKVATSGTGVLTFDKGVMGAIGNEFILTLIVVTVITAIMAVYLKNSKHGYELSVVGESTNTAKYIGINVKKVIIRTLAVCGIVCGITGFLMVSAINHNLSSTTVGGRGFTGVLVSWLGHFNPLAIALTSFLVIFAERGASNVGNLARLGDSYPNVIVGIFFFFIIATEFFINYQIVLRDEDKIKAFFAKLFGRANKKPPTPVADGAVALPASVADGAEAASEAATLQETTAATEAKEDEEC